MLIASHFPSGIATGLAFCNREKERALLKNQLSQNAHVALISPRRYGKIALLLNLRWMNTFHLLPLIYSQRPQVNM